MQGGSEALGLVDLLHERLGDLPVVLQGVLVGCGVSYGPHARWWECGKSALGRVGSIKHRLVHASIELFRLPGFRRKMSLCPPTQEAVAGGAEAGNTPPSFSETCRRTLSH